MPPTKGWPWKRYQRRSAVVEAFRNTTGRYLQMRPAVGAPLAVRPGDWVVQDHRGVRAIAPEIFETLYEPSEE